MMLELSQQFYFEAAHTLRRQYDTAGSLRVHGHTYNAEVTVAGEPGPDGFIMDLAVLHEKIAGVRGSLDHMLLDEVPGLGPATLENLCLYIGRAIPDACRVAVWRAASGDRCEMRRPIQASLPCPSNAHSASVMPSFRMSRYR